MDMPDALKQEYYKKNRDKRLEYQHAYYQNNKDRIKRVREVKRDADPEWVEKQRLYNREYYKKNKEKIKDRRKKLRDMRDK